MSIQSCADMAIEHGAGALVGLSHSVAISLADARGQGGEAGAERLLGARRRVEAERRSDAAARCTFAAGCDGATAAMSIDGAKNGPFGNAGGVYVPDRFCRGRG